MTIETLRDLRDQLHTELSGAGEIEPDRRALLLEVKTEIDHLLAREPDAPALSPADTQHLQGRLQSAAVGFEGSHPQLASTLERALIVLSNMGL
jgi:hypothetical protein